MASVKNRKSKSKGRFGMAGTGVAIADYDYRRAEFVQQAPVLVRPLRTIKAWAAQAGRDLNEKLTALMAANPNASFTEVGQRLRQEFGEVRIRMAVTQRAEKHAKRGDGKAVHHEARWAVA